MGRLKIEGTWVGVLEEVELDAWTIPMLREEVAKRSNCPSNSINLISDGKFLNGTQNLTELGIKNNSKILTTRVSTLDDISRWLARIRGAADAMAARNANRSLTDEDFRIELVDLNEKKTCFSLSKRSFDKIVMMGMLFHAKGMRLIEQRNYQDAIEVLRMGEETFLLCNTFFLRFQILFNFLKLQIDIVWCYFMMQDIRWPWPSDARERLEMVRGEIDIFHTRNIFRRNFRADRYLEVVMLLRLELLEGVVAYHDGQLEKSRKALESAKAKFVELQVPEKALSHVMSMGAKERDAKKALRISRHDVAGAIKILIDAEEQYIVIREQQRLYGLTTTKEHIDLEELRDLLPLVGNCDEELVVEALRRHNNSFHVSKDDCRNPEIKSSLQVDADARKRERQKQEKDLAIKKSARLAKRSSVAVTFEAGGSAEEAMQRLAKAIPDVNSAPAPHESSSSSSDSDDYDVEDILDLSKAEERDVEMENELAEDIADKASILVLYDIEIDIEGKVITEYLALIDSAENSREKVSSQ